MPMGEMTVFNDPARSFFSHLNVFKGIFSFHVVFNGKIPVDDGLLTSWTFLLLLQRRRESNAGLQCAKLESSCERKLLKKKKIATRKRCAGLVFTFVSVTVVSTKDSRSLVRNDAAASTNLIPWGS